MRRYLAVGMLVSLVLGTVLALRHRANSTMAVVSSAPGGRCQSTSASTIPLLNELTAAPLVLVKNPSIQLSVDGLPPGATLAPGRHQLQATAPNVIASLFDIEIEPFMPVLLEARVSFGTVTVMMMGARCVSCIVATTDIELEYRPEVPLNFQDIAKAISTGDWVRAAQAMRGIEPAARQKPEIIRLFAIVYAFSGRPSAAREHLNRLPLNEPLRSALANRDSLESLIPSQRLEAAMARWNITVERFARLTERFVNDAPETLTALTHTFDSLTTRLNRGLKQHDPKACEATIEIGVQHLNKTVSGLRALHPEDCEWQQRVTDAF